MKFTFCAATILSVLSTSFALEKLANVDNTDTSNSLKPNGNILQVSLKDVANLDNIAKDNEINVMVVTDLSEEYSDALKQMRNDGPGCLSSLPHLHKRVTDDGGERTTFAYDQNSNGPDCIPSMKVIDKEFDLVHEQLVNGFTQVVGNPEILAWYNGDGTKHYLTDAPYKAHIHVYENHNNFDHEVGEGSTVPYHVDNGIYLLLTPSSVGLRVKNTKGEEIDLSNIPSNSIIMLMGSAMSEWLLQYHEKAGKQFPAVPHAVPSMPVNVEHRTVYARMRIANADAAPQGEDPLLFSDVFMQGAHSNVHQTRNRFLRDAADECITLSNDAQQCWMAMRQIPEQCVGANDITCSMYNSTSDERVNCTLTNQTIEGLPMGSDCKLTCAAAQQANTDDLPTCATTSTTSSATSTPGSASINNIDASILTGFLALLFTME